MEHKESFTSSNRLRRMADLVPQLLFTADASGRLDFVNRRCCEYTGFPVGKLLEVTCRTLRQVVHSEDMLRAVAQIEVAIASGEKLELELRLRSVDAEFRWFLVRAIPSLDNAGNVFAWFGSATDIDDLKHTEDVVRTLENLNTAKESVEGLGMALLGPLADLEDVLESALMEHALSQDTIRHLLQARQKVLAMERQVAGSLNRQSFVTLRKISDFYKPEQPVEKSGLYTALHDCGLDPGHVPLTREQRFPSCENCMRLRYKLEVTAPLMGNDEHLR